MSDFKELLEQERRRHAMPGASFQDLERRRDRKRRNRRLTSGVVALAIAAAGVGGGLYAFHGTRTANPVTTLSPTPTLPTQAGVSPQVSGPIGFVDDQRGWMVDGNGQILATTDGGTTWTVQPSDPSTVKAIDMLDGEHGWAVFDGGLLQTTDGGASWVTRSNQSLSSVEFISPQVGWGVETPTDQPAGKLVKTEDGGLTWTQQALDVDSVCFVDDTTGWAAGPSQGGLSLFRTGDGGQHWKETALGLQGADFIGYHATVRCAGLDAWVLATGDGGAGHIAYAVLRTVGGGSQAHPVLQDAFTHPLGQGGGIPEASNPQPGPFAVLDGSNARVVTWCPPCGGGVPYVSLERTQDGGATWTDPTVVDANQPGEPLGISFLDPDRGWILLRDHQTDTLTVLRTTDGGQTWVQP